MTDLQDSISKAGFTNVKTLINSGNVIFDSKITDNAKITGLVEKAISRLLHTKIDVIILNSNELRAVVDKAPKMWKIKNNLRKYIAFVKKPVITSEVLTVVKLNKEVDSIKEGSGVLYMSTLLSGITKSGFSRLAGKKVYKAITIRNFNTVQKLYSTLNLFEDGYPKLMEHEGSD